MSQKKEPSSGGGCGCLPLLGVPVAVICSWTLNHSIVWAVVHGAVWPFYLLYLCFGCGGGLPKEVAPW